ncbi:hypothetical protein HGI30_01980 [Paenibacillus albicereus]|uniref:Uncharacterized protein n=1 Tax=Paenibacillus albicereus TaxID=2726185 RepID=A0A6H2GTK0_9BACL|nr:phage holin, LLH family [Paenibacillus albicereus]QJC50478.1 hypothetical protein HGI30_01980 [Paenibacillus albicereus]
MLDIEEWPVWAAFAEDAMTALLALAVIVAAPILCRRGVAYLSVKAGEHQRVLLHRIAEEAAALAESAYPNGGGPQKLAMAMKYAQEQLRLLGIRLGQEALRASIEKAVLDYNAMIKPWEGIPASAVIRSPYGEGVSQ